MKNAPQRTGPKRAKTKNAPLRTGPNGAKKEGNSMNIQKFTQKS